MTPLSDLNAIGQSVWIDFLSRSFVRDGDLGGLVAQGVSGVTSNPTIFEQAVASGEYDVPEGEDPKEVFLTIAQADIQGACDLLRGTWDATGHRDGWVSLEVDPTLAYDADATVAEAEHLLSLIARPNLLVKVPATEPGVAAFEELTARGISVNVTLIFSLQRHRAVCEAYLRGLRRSSDPSGVASVGSFFISRVDSEVDKRLDALPGHGHLKGAAAIANAKLAYVTYQEVFSGPEWEALEAKKATKQRCLWASTSTKNPAYRDVIYVEELVGPDTVNTMPRETIEAVQDHAVIRETLTEDVDGAREVLRRFAEAGIDYDDVVETLEREGVEKFAKSFRDLFSDLESKRDALVTA
jgi:transaldolase